jgi:outer membrane receptor protein involved in Fe transport
MKLYYLLFLLLAIPLQSYSQSEFAIRGQVIDDNDAPVPFSNVVLYTASDSSMATGAVSDDEGRFSITTPPGQYYLLVTFISYRDKLVPGITVSSADVNLGTVVLSSGRQLLEEVVVSGERELMEMRLDKRIFNISQDISNIGVSASEVLDNLPSVTVDAEGNVSFRGSENVRILIDGRPSRLTSAEALQQLQSDMIERIEVITNPSSRYEAEGEAGVINIILKKNVQRGLNGSFTVTGGYPALGRGSVNLNYRHNKINYFGSYGINYRATPATGSSFQEFTGADTSFVYEQTRDRLRSGLGHNARIGADYFINDYNTLSASFFIRASEGLNTNIVNYRDQENLGNGTITSLRTRSEEEEEQDLNTETTVSYRRDFEEEGRSFTADARLIHSWEIEQADYREFNPERTVDITQRSDNREMERNFIFQTDYVHPFGETGVFEAGLRTAWRKLDNNFRVDQLFTEGGWLPLPQFNNHFIYIENVHAAYVMAGREFNRFSTQGGLRGEYSDVNTLLLRTNDTNPRRYFNLFPSAHLSYELTDASSLQLSYSYRINRPSPRNLLPFANFSDPRVIWRGNPNLDPEFTHSVEASYLLNTDNGTFLSSVYRRYRTNPVQRITITDPATGLREVFPVNLGTEDSYGLEMNWSHTFFDIWRLNSNINLFRSVTQGNFEGRDLFADTYAGNGRIQSKLTVFNNLEFQTAFNYRSPRIVPQGRNLSLYFMDVGLAKPVLKGKGTLVASVNDVFNTRRFRSIIEDEGLSARSDFQWRPRQFVITFTYRINQRQDRRGERREQDEDRRGGMDEGEF